MKAKRPLGSEAVYLHTSTVDCLARVLEQSKHPDQIQALWDGFASVLYDHDMSRIFRHMEYSREANQNTMDSEIEKAKAELNGLDDKYTYAIAVEKERHQQALTELSEEREKEIESLRAKIKTLESVGWSTPFEVLEAHTANA